MVSPIYVDAGAQPKMLRAFLDFEGDRKRRITHNIGVASPSGINYSFDLGRGNLVCGWRGKFVDATPMWFNRGDGSFRPRGAVQFTYFGQAIANLENGSAPFPESPSEITPKGYDISEADGLPSFKYMYKDIMVHSSVKPDAEGKYLTHQVKLENLGGEMPTLHYKMAEGKEITKIAPNLYKVEGKEYFIEVADGQTTILRELENGMDLIAPIKSELSYKFMW